MNDEEKVNPFSPRLAECRALIFVLGILISTASAAIWIMNVSRTTPPPDKPLQVGSVAVHTVTNKQQGKVFDEANLWL